MTQGRKESRDPEKVQSSWEKSAEPGKDQSLKAREGAVT